MGIVTGAFGNAMTMGSPQSLDTSANGNKLSDPDKQKRLELLTYVKAHFDLIAVTLLVGYLGYALYNETKKRK
jgi:hypothetical protein